MRKHLVGMLAALGALAGCGIFESDPNDLGTMLFELRNRTLDSLPPQILLVVTTGKELPCLNYALQGSVGFGYEGVFVDLYGTELVGDACIQSPGPAEFSYPINFGPVRNGNTALLRIKRGGLVDDYMLTVSDTSVDIETVRASFTRPVAHHLSRGP